MSGEQVLYRSPMLHRLIREADGQLVIEVVVGRMAMSAVRVRLNTDEAKAWSDEGEAFVDELAAKITADPKFGGRAYPAD